MFNEYFGCSFQFDYDNWLAEQCGYLGVEGWRKQMYNAVSKNRLTRPETYRDEWDDHHLILQAQEDFIKYTSNRVTSKYWAESGNLSLKVHTKSNLTSCICSY